MSQQRVGQQKQKANKHGRFQAHHNAPKSEPQFNTDVLPVVLVQPYKVENGTVLFQRRAGVWTRANAEHCGTFIVLRGMTTDRVGHIPELTANDYNAMRKMGVLI